MSVQAGVWNFDGQPVNRDVLARIGHTVATYGPDGEATYLDDPVEMLYRPFHTTSESRLERQPHISASGKIMTWDGRLDNRDELIPQIHIDPRAQDTDLAIVAASFDRWGTDCFAKLTGDWAFVMWDPRHQQLILARDYAGIRHLFYYLKPKSIIWCTHLEPLALCGDQFTLCDEYLAGYLAFWPEAHLTPYREIHSVPPGKFVSIRHGRVSIHSYWTFNPKLKTRYKTDAEYEEHFSHLFRRAVRLRLRTDSSILADLSGGLDSPSIVCMADDILANEGAETPAVDTFSAIYRDEPNDEDAFYLTKIEERRGRVGHHAELCGEGDAFSFQCPDFVATPGFDTREDLRSANSDLIKRGRYRVLLSGTGGDEMLGQAIDPRVQIADLLRQFRFAELAKELRAWSLLLRRPWMHLLLNAFLLQLPLSISTRITEIAKADPWVNKTVAQRQKLAARQSNVGEGSSFWLPSVRDWFHTLMTLRRQMTKTRPSIAETRYPYLDQKLVEFLMSIPTEQLLRPGQRRSLMRRALVDFLPPELLARKTKSAGGRSIVVSLQKHWNRLENIVTSPFISRLGYVNQAQFYTSLLVMKNGSMTLDCTRLIRALSLELWLRDAITRQVISLQPEVQAHLGTE